MACSRPRSKSSYSSVVKFTVFLLLALFMQVHFDEVDGFSEEDRKYMKDTGFDPDTISPDAVIIKPPSYTDEEEHSFGMPKSYRCDGCRIIGYQLQTHFSSEEKKLGASKTSLSESDLIDIVEGICKEDFGEYGLMNTPGGKKYLQGPGLDTPPASGSIDKGPLWTKRLQHMCLEILDTYDEDELYQMYKRFGKALKESHLCAKYCKGPKRKTEL